MIRLHFLSALLLLLFFSCNDNFSDSFVEEEVVNEELQVTVRAHLFDNGPNQLIYIYHSKGLLDSIITPIIDAKVDLYEEEYWIQKFVLEPNAELCETYIAESVIFKPEKNYTLKIETKDGIVESRQAAPTKVPINNAIYKKEGAIDPDGNRVDAISIEFDDPEGEKNYYSVSVRATYLFENQDTSFIISDFWVQSTSVDPIVEYQDGFFFSDDLIDGEKYTFQYTPILKQQQPWPSANGDIIEGQLVGLTAKLTSISKDYFLYWKSWITFRNNRDDFLMIHENLEGGSGIFTLNLVDEYPIEM